jgi:hypothetical protein
MGTGNIELEFVESTNINALGYDPASATMAVQFRGGKTYHYAGVPQHEYDAVRTAGSIGSTFLDLIRHRYTGVAQS